MKNKYVCDKHDYTKYGLLRTIIGASGIRLSVAWMLTPDDGSYDGNHVAYLGKADAARHDPVLHETLNALMASGRPRHVGMIQKSNLLLGATYFSDQVPDDVPGRKAWSSRLVLESEQADMVFLDPDNGLEVKRPAYGNKGSSKYVYRREVEMLWKSGKSLVIYQHRPREAWDKCIPRKAKELKEAAQDSRITAFVSGDVAFFLVLQPEHRRFREKITSGVRENWSGWIKIWDHHAPNEGHQTMEACHAD